MSGDVLSEKIHVPLVRSMVRDRLDAVMSGARERRLALVIGPAGCGKTTLLARFAETAPGRVAWYQADEDDADPRRLLRYLDAAFARVVPGLGRHESVDGLVADLAALEGPVHLVIDDLHTLHGTEAERMAGRLIRYYPRPGTIAAATRREPAVDLTRLRLEGGLLEVDADTLRFRTWEVEQLFRDHYASPLTPTELAELARRTGGWAAALQLFHLATDGRPPSARREVLGALATRSRVVRDYLTRNVLDGLDPLLRAFLLETCVLTDVDAELCDELRSAVGSGALLAELDHRRLLVTARSGSAYRYHEVLRHHLHGMLLDEIGDAAVRARFGVAAELLERRGRLAQALIAYARAGEDDDVRRLLGVSGEALAGDPGDWIASIPTAMVAEDPWVSLAVARWLVRTGRGREAIDAYRDAERLFASGRGSDLCRRERSAVQLLAIGAPARQPAGESWVRWAQHALRRRTAPPPPPPGTAIERLVAALDAALGRAPAEGIARLRELGDDDSRVVRAVAALAAAVAPHWAPGSPPAPASVLALVAEAEAAAGSWAGRIGAALGALTGLPAAVAAAEELASGESPEPWSALVAAYAAACGRLHDPAGAAAAGQAFARCTAQAEAADVPLLRAWALAGQALAAASEGAPAAAALAAEAERTARSLRVAGAEAVAGIALASAADDAVHRRRSLARACELGLDLRPPWSSAAPARAGTPPAGGRPRVTVRTFGGLVIEVAGEAVALDELKPRWRSLLALMALHAGTPVHRDVLVAALWPAASEAAGRRSLQVAISALRSALEAGGGPVGLPRLGDTYELTIPSDGWCDHRHAETRLRQGRVAARSGDLDGAAAHYADALGACGGELLPEEGNEEWVLEHRERWRYVAADAATELAAVHLDRRDWAAAEHAAAVGLGIDRHRDALWRHRLTALERAGEPAAASRVRAMYHEVLADLGIEPPTRAGVSA